jgi:ketosteroid isomerase-like protein
MASNAALIEQFYQAFQQRDAEGMIACYHPQVTFSDPVFQQLQSDQARAMWRMLTKSSADLALTYQDVTADEQRGQADWIATYTFTQTGRKVRNVIHAEFQFQDGTIFVHHDTFDLWRWASMALGPRGSLLGWTPLAQNAIRQQARKRLEKFMQQQDG